MKAGENKDSPALFCAPGMGVKSRVETSAPGFALGTAANVKTSTLRVEAIPKKPDGKGPTRRAGIAYRRSTKAPLAGAGFRYPETFDIIVFRDQAAALIRQGQAADLTPLSDYEFGGGLVMNGRGFGVMMSSAEVWARAKADCALLAPDNQAVLAKLWLDYNAFHRVAMGGRGRFQGPPLTRTRAESVRSPLKTMAPTFQRSMASARP